MKIIKGVILATFLLFIIITVVVIKEHKNKPVTNEKIVTRNTKIILYSEKMVMSDVISAKESDINWHNNIDEAFEDEDFELYDDKVLFAQFENDYLVRRFYYSPKQHTGKSAICLDVIKKNGLYSNAVFYGEVLINQYEIIDFKYNCADNVAEGLWANYLNVIPFYENHAVDCFGFWSNEDDLKNVTIEGQSLNEFYELKYDDGTSYVMWKLSLDDVQDKLKSIKGDVTPGVIIETLDIKSKEAN